MENLPKVTEFTEIQSVRKLNYKEYHIANVFIEKPLKKNMIIIALQLLIMPVVKEMITA